MDDNIRVLLKGSFSGRVNSHPVFYEFSSSSINSALGRLFITNLGNGYAEVMVPIPSELSNININLRVKDLVKPQLVSQAITATLQIEKVSSLPPVADAGEYSEFLLQPNQQNITVQLDGRGSFSPVGNSITFLWEYQGSNNVFGDSNTSVDTISAVTLEEGEHEFLVTVTDVTTGESSTDSVTLVVKSQLSLGTYYMSNHMFRYSDEEMYSNKKMIQLTYMGSLDTDIRTMTVKQSVLNSNFRKLSFYDTTVNTGTAFVSFRIDTFNPLKIDLISLGRGSAGSSTIETAHFSLPIDKLNVNTLITDTVSGATLNLDTPSTSVQGSESLSDGAFFPIEINAGNRVFTLILGSVKSSFGGIRPLGIVGHRGLLDSDTLYLLEKADIKGFKFPARTGSVDEAINEAKRLSADGLRAAHQISASLLNSSNQSSRREANLIYAITNLAMHLNDNRDPVRTLTKLLDKLNVTSTGRDLFDLMAKLESGQSGEILLNDFQGLSELQSYFADTPDSLCAAIDRSLQALESIENTISPNTPSYEVIMTLDWTDSTVYFQRKDLHLLHSAFHTLKFVLHF